MRYASARSWLSVALGLLLLLATGVLPGAGIGWRGTSQPIAARNALPAESGGCSATAGCLDGQRIAAQIAVPADAPRLAGKGLPDREPDSEGLLPAAAVLAAAVPVAATRAAAAQPRYRRRARPGAPRGPPGPA